MSSPAPCPVDNDVSTTNNPFMDIPSRLMRVKILYTFDDNSTTNCLARIRDVVSVPTVPIDESSHIGVIDLRQCIRAIVEHSPEILARLSQGDFTIYAFDYSEHETPLVGQGMLSALLTTTSPAVAAQADQSKTMITGRVGQNVMAAFRNDVSDTLEVKLRLVPVPKPVQSGFSKSMEMYRNMSPALSGGFDPNAWSNSQAGDNAIVASLEQQSQTFEYQSNVHQRHMSNASTHGRPNLTRQSRPSSRASVRSSHGRPTHESSIHEGFAEDGSAPKRAKITQAEWKGRSAFTDNPDSLRVTASTAASIRVHKPVATRPGHSLDPPPRVPTPIPAEKSNRFKGQSFLRRESSLYHAETPQSSYDNNSDAVMSSPEDMNGQADNSPLDFPSSPPVMPDVASPGPLLQSSMVDSGYMSGGQMEYIQEDEERPDTKRDRKQTARSKARSQSRLGSDISFIEQTPGPPELLPTRMSMSGKPVDNQKAHNSVQLSRRDSTLALPPRPTLSAQTSNLSEAPITTPSPFPDQNELDCTQLYFTQYPQPYPVPQPATKPALGATTQSAPMSIPSRSAAASPAPSEGAPFGGKPRSGSGAKRKKVIQEKLLQSLASGAMPTYCANCGAIETPTWRILHVKYIQGSPPDDKCFEGEDETVGIDITERDETSQEVTQYRIIKSIRKNKQKPDANDFRTIQVCNPCGLWFNKFKQMRPPEKWSKGPKAVRKKSKQRDDLASDVMEFHSDMPMSGLWTDGLQPDDQTLQIVGLECRDIPQETTEDAQEQRPAPRPRASSIQAVNRQPPKLTDWTSNELDTALRPTVQSSPGQVVGTELSPIELEDELTPRPTRRLLFPSPRKDGEMKSLDSTTPSTKLKSTKTSPVADTNNTLASINFALQVEKENLPPISSFHDDLDFSALFQSPSTSAFFKTPTKSSLSSGSAKTPPSKSIDRFESLLATPTPSKRNSTLTSRTPTRMDAFLPSFSSAEKKTLGTPSRYMPLTSPCRSTRSVSGRSTSGQRQANTLLPMTPFTRQLTQLLSDNPGFDFTSDIACDGSGDGMNFSFFSPGGLGLGEWGNSPGRALDFGLGTPKKVEEGQKTVEDSKGKIMGEHEQEGEDGLTA